MKQKTTVKKIKVVGTRQFIDAATGEIQTMQVSTIEERDFNFYKVWMRNFISTLDLVGNQKTKVAFWVIDNLNRENQLLYTYRQIAEKSGISLETVRVTMGILQDADFLRRRNQGCYVVNPDIIFKGEKSNRLNVLNQYRDAERVELSDEEKLQNINRSISATQNILDRLLKQSADLQSKIATKNEKDNNKAS